MRYRIILPALLARLRETASLVMSGGGWSRQLQPDIQRNLRWYFTDGVFSSSQDAINGTFLTLYVLALGATKSQIGLMASLASIGAMLLLLPGAMTMERTGMRKWLVIATGGGISRLCILGLALLPFLAQGSAAIALAIAMKVVMDSSAYFSVPAWTSLTADIVPLEWRGRYFGTRNMVMGIASILVTLLAGQIITSSANEITGYQTAYGLALVFGAVASFAFSQIQEPALQPDPAAMAAYKPAVLWKTLRSNAFFLRYSAAQMLWNFSIMVAGPFFGVYQIEVLKSTAAIIGVQTVMSPLAAIPAQHIFGRLNDKWGERRVLNLTGFLVPLLPFLWIFTRGPWDPIPLNIFGGIIWAGYNLANFNFLLSNLPQQNLGRYTALYQFMMLLSSAAGAAVGGVVIDLFDYRLMFLLSAIGRLAGHILLYRLFRQTPPAPPAVNET